MKGIYTVQRHNQTEVLKDNPDDYAEWIPWGQEDAGTPGRRYDGDRVR